VTSEEFEDLVAGLSTSQKLKVLRLLALAAAHPSAGQVLDECNKRGLDLDATVAELSKSLWSK